MANPEQPPITGSSASSRMVASLFSTDLDRAQRRAATWHLDQFRKGGATPYVVHPFAVSLILDRLGFPEEVLIAALLHDVVEDCGVSIEQVEAEFGPEVARIVACCSERKRDAQGAQRPWRDRKEEHLAELGRADVPARAVALADKLHNLASIRTDLELAGPDGDPGRVWSRFNADPDSLRWYYQTAIRTLAPGDERLGHLARACQDLLDAMLPAPTGSGAIPGSGG